MQTTDTNLLTELLIQNGIRRIYGTHSGVGTPLQEAVQQSSRLQWIVVPQEESAAHAAAAETSLTGCPAAWFGAPQAAADGSDAGTARLNRQAAAGVFPAPLHLLHPAQQNTAMPPAEQLVQMAQLMNAAPRVTFICGSGCAAARADLLALAERMQCPVVYTLRSKEFMEHDNPYGVGMTGPAGFGAAPQTVLEADLLVFWGADFADVEFLPLGSRMIQVHEDAAALGRYAEPLLALQGNIGGVARALLPLAAEYRDGEFLTAARERHRRCLTRLNRSMWAAEAANTLRPEYLMRLVSDYAEPDAVFTTDAGAPLIWAARYLQVGPRRRLLGTERQGTAGSAAALALGAKAAYPTRQVVALCHTADPAGLQSLLEVLQQGGMAVKLLVFNRHTVENRPALPATDFAAMARSLGVHAAVLQQSAAAPELVKEWLAHPGPALLDAAVDPCALPLPPDMRKLSEMSYCTLRKGA